MSPWPVSDPDRLAISLCMQCGNVLPAPTTNELPHAFAPSAKFSCCWAHARHLLDPPYFSYSAPVMYRPKACGDASDAPSWVPSPNGSPFAAASPVRSCAAMSVSTVLGASTGVPPASCIAWSSSDSATAPLSYRLNVSRPRWARYARVHLAAVERSACTCAPDAPVASSASASSAAPHAMSLFHSVPG